MPRDVLELNLKCAWGPRGKAGRVQSAFWEKRDHGACEGSPEK